MRRLVLVLLVAAGCGEDRPAEFLDCAMGELTGTWRATYETVDGNCGDVAAETLILTPGQVDESCTVNSLTITTDRCQMSSDVVCPLPGGGGTQRWVLALEQVWYDEVTGTGTAELVTASDYCRGTYDIEIVQLQ